MNRLTRTVARFARIALLVVPAACACAEDLPPPAPPPPAPPLPVTTLDRARALEIVAGVRRIATPEGIDELRQVELGGVKQWISIRGRNRANPVLLVLHGGPGTPLLPYAWAFQSPWEDFFTVVQWEQRGSGRNATVPGALAPDLLASLTVERVVADGIELVDYLRTRFGKNKVAVLGLSWGTIVGTHVAKRVPEKLSVYVGTGQFVTLDGEADLYAGTLAAAERAGDREALAALRALAPYPDPDPAEGFRKAGMVRSIAVKYGFWYGHADFALLDRVPLLAPEYGTATLAAWKDAQWQISRALFADMQRRGEDLRKLGPEFRVPVVYLMGRYDLFTPYVAVQRYYEWVRAPSKRFVSFERSAHFVMLEEPGRFLQALLQDVLPFTEGSPPPRPLP